MTVNTKQTIQIESTHLAPGEVITETYWAVAGDYTFRRCEDQTEAVALCAEPMWRAVELRAVVVRPDGCQLDSPLLAYVPEVATAEPPVRIAADGYPAWEPGDDLAAAIRATDAYTTEAVRLGTVKAEAEHAWETYTARHGGVIDWLAYNEALREFDRARQDDDE